MHADQRIRDVTLAVDFVAFLIRPPLLSHPSFLLSVSVACMHGEVVGIYRSSENVINAMRNECNGFLTGWAMMSLKSRPLGSSLSWARDWYILGSRRCRLGGNPAPQPPSNLEYSSWHRLDGMRYR